MHLEILVEEPSAEIALHNLLPKLVTEEHTYRIITFQGKRDLLGKLELELKGYKRWIPENFKIIVLVDRDDQDCHVLKECLERNAQNANLVTKTSSQGNRNYSVVNRIVIEELEAWFFGDNIAVNNAYPRVSASFHSKARYRNPDHITGGTWEALERVLKAGGYYKSGFRKTEVAYNISLHMEPLRNRSKSFQVFWGAISEVIEDNLVVI
jgi:hypothetical protein